MNHWPSYLYNQSTPEERIEITLLMLRKIEQRRKISAMSRAFRITWHALPYPLVEHRSSLAAHYIGDRRSQAGRITPRLAIVTSICMMAVTAVSLLMSALMHPAHIVMPILYALYTTGVLAIRQARLAAQS
jgi:hypothetical protein